MAYTKTSFICLLLLLYMGVFHFSQKHLPLKSTRLFNWYYFSALTVVLFDFITLCTVNMMDIVPLAINTLAHTIYLLAINVMLYFIFLYEQSLLGDYLKISKTLRALESVPFLLSSLCIMFLPLYYVEGTFTNYSSGPKIYVLYVCAILYNIIFLYYGIRYTRFLPKDKRTALLASVPIFAIVTVVTIVFPESLCVILYVILSAVGLLMTSENTEKYIDKQTGMFNQYALGVVIREFIERKKQRIAIIISLSEVNNINPTIDWRSYISILEQLQRFCLKEFKRQVYRIGDNGFVLLARRKDDADKYAARIVDYTQKICNASIHVDSNMIPLSDYTEKEEFMSRIVDICIEAMNKFASFDFLTGTRNRNSFEKFLNQLKKDQIDVYYFIADINNLKETNDVLGHAAGDELIQTVAKLLSDTVGGDGWVFRQGGDEFAVLWKGNDAEDFLKLLEHKRQILNKQRNVPASYAIGYGKILDSNGMEDADKMMYRNKAEMKAKRKAGKV